MSSLLYWNIAISSFPPMVFYRSMPVSDLKKATPERDRDRVRSVIGPQLVHQVLDVKVNRSLGDRQLAGNLLVAIAIPDQPQHLQLPGRKIFVTYMFGKAGCHLRRNVPSPSLDGSHDVEQFIFRHALQDVSRRSRSHGSLDLAIAV